MQSVAFLFNLILFTSCLHRKDTGTRPGSPVIHIRVPGEPGNEAKFLGVVEGSCLLSGNSFLGLLLPNCVESEVRETLYNI